LVPDAIPDGPDGFPDGPDGFPDVPVAIPNTPDGPSGPGYIEFADKL
jgi:hypothetical protein